MLAKDGRRAGLIVLGRDVGVLAVVGESVGTTAGVNRQPQVVPS